MSAFLNTVTIFLLNHNAISAFLCHSLISSEFRPHKPIILKLHYAETTKIVVLLTTTRFNLLKVSVQNCINCRIKCVYHLTQDWHKVGRRILTKTLAPRWSLRCCYCCISDSLITSVPANCIERVTEK